MSTGLPAPDHLAAPPVLGPVPSGAWAVGVSGGADSVALLSLLRARRDLQLHVVHLDHQTRGEASRGDADFVRDLAAGWGLPCTVARRDDLEQRAVGLPANPSARYRALRLALYREVIGARGPSGVLLAHHADDQAETVLHRLMRGSAFSGLAGMDARAAIGGVLCVRPLLATRAAQLRRYLRDQNQPWREDASNTSGQYLRNRLRRVLASHPQLSIDLLDLADACRALRDWTQAAAPDLEPAFPVRQLRALPPLPARESARRWLLACGVPPADLARSPAAADWLVTLAIDAAAPRRRHFPGGLLIGRSRGIISVIR